MTWRPAPVIIVQVAFADPSPRRNIARDPDIAMLRLWNSVHALFLIPLQISWRFYYGNVRQ